jgi:ribonucleoside-triphosphate reductase
MLSDERLFELMGPAGCGCMQRTEVYSRVCGFFRPVSEWNKGKKEEYRQRLNYRAEEV